MPFLVADAACSAYDAQCSSRYRETCNIELGRAQPSAQRLVHVATWGVVKCDLSQAVLGEGE